MLFSNDVTTEIIRVFTSPSQPLKDDRTPILYLLRKDLECLYGREGMQGPTVSSPFLACLGIMVGFDLLTKMWTGDYQAQNKDLASFIEKVAGQSPDKAEALVQFRHALVHGYRLSTRRKKQEVFSFQIEDQIGTTQSIVEVEPKIYRTNIWKLKDLFLQSVEQYRRLLEASFELQKKFMVCVANLGDVQIVP